MVTVTITIASVKLADTTTYTMTIDDTEVSELVVDTTTRKVVNIETRRAHQYNGYARTLWEYANRVDGECFHAVDHHRTPEGDTFARSVGGETIDAELDIIDECSVCTDE